MAQKWASKTCYTLRRNLASLIKDLILKIVIERFSRKKEIIINQQTLINQKKKLIKFDKNKNKKFDKDNFDLIFLMNFFDEF